MRNKEVVSFPIDAHTMQTHKCQSAIQTADFMLSRNIDSVTNARGLERFPYKVQCR